jgi:hypothetical protein
VRSSKVVGSPERGTASRSAQSCSILISTQSLGGGLAEGLMGVFPFAAAMVNRTSVIWSRPGWWRGYWFTVSPWPLLPSAQRFNQVTPTDSARHADLALRRFPAYIQGNQLQRTPIPGRHARGLGGAIAIERAPPTAA